MRKDRADKERAFCLLGEKKKKKEGWNYRDGKKRKEKFADGIYNSLTEKKVFDFVQ